MDVPLRYVELCLRLGRHIDGFIDAYVGPADIKRKVEAEKAVEPEELRVEAETLLVALEGSDLQDDRRRWLRGQLGALECIAARLSGVEISWTEEVERCLGVPPTRTDTRLFEEVHQRLDSVLTGSGTLRDRYISWEERNAVPRDRLIPALESLKEVLRSRAHEMVDLPEEESVAYELVAGEPWVAYNWYQGDNHSRVDINADLPVSLTLLTDLAAHEAYPGHHTERTVKDRYLYKQLGRVETTVVVLSTPESLVSEGIATNALQEALGKEPFRIVADVLAHVGMKFDPVEAAEIHDADKVFFEVMTNAALILNEDGATVQEAEEYAAEWALQSKEKAARTVEFIQDPASYAYAPAYSEGRRLVREVADKAPDNFARLLTEQLTTTDLQAP